MSYFNDDRRIKYAQGSVRLASVLCVYVLYHNYMHTYMHNIDINNVNNNVNNVAITNVVNEGINHHGIGSNNCIINDLCDNNVDNDDYFDAWKYWESYRWLIHVYIGSIGAMVNVQVFSFHINLLLLLVAGIMIVKDVMTFDPALVIYAMKTFGGDYLAGKLDTTEWLLVLFFSFLIGPLLVHYTTNSLVDVVFVKYAKILGLLFVGQVICECGDNYLESMAFFRYRYSYECCSLFILLCCSLQSFEKDVVIFDMVICEFYRISNWIIILIQTGALATPIKKFMFTIAGYKLRTRLIHVENPTIASMVMKQSVHKGFFLERYIALPAWSPIISLESIDGSTWKQMRADFDKLLSVLPPVQELQNITRKHAVALVRGGKIIDANELARLTIKIYLEYVFQVDWREEFEVFVEGSWEWRKQIAVRGEGSRDVKSRAVDVLLNKLLVPHPVLWALFGEKWRDPRYFSLILQPFIISPCINTGDILVAVKRCGPATSLEDAIRWYHPFPILERFVTSDIIYKGVVVVPSQTQVIMFTPDFNLTSSTGPISSGDTARCPHNPSVSINGIGGATSNAPFPWPIFGAGERSCAGAHLALPFLRVLRQVLLEGNLTTATSEEAPDAGHSDDVKDQFQPELNHLYSGRHNDGKVESLGELWYFLRTVASAMWIAKAYPDDL